MRWEGQLLYDLRKMHVVNCHEKVVRYITNIEKLQKILKNIEIKKKKKNRVSQCSPKKKLILKKKF